MDPQARLTCEQLLDLEFVRVAGEDRDKEKAERVSRGRYGQRAQGRSRVRIYDGWKEMKGKHVELEVCVRRWHKMSVIKPKLHWSNTHSNTTVYLFYLKSSERKLSEPEKLFCLA